MKEMKDCKDVCVFAQIYLVERIGVYFSGTICMEYIKILMWFRLGWNRTIKY